MLPTFRPRDAGTSDACESGVGRPPILSPFRIALLTTVSAFPAPVELGYLLLVLDKLTISFHPIFKILFIGQSQSQDKCSFIQAFL